MAWAFGPGARGACVAYSRDAKAEEYFGAASGWRGRGRATGGGRIRGEQRQAE